ncbi:MAG TPA: hypothetical protein EYH06_08710 [Chromatiales bacterium]|nr:hypothetical protein [Thiotrichales bacterium]HIP68656.1 hypothetical protein [Chromatiales bacterium]
MFSNKLITALAAIFIASTFTACGGGGGDDGGGSAGVTKTAVTSSGTITAFGSVIVNGVRYETGNARIISADDDSVILENPTNAQLQAVIGLGQVITVRGSQSDSSNGVADSIRFDNELVGAISSVSAADGSFVVHGQTVSVSPDTIIDDSIIEAARGVEIPNDLPFGGLPERLDQLLVVGMVVEVSGFPTQNGLQATRIEDVNNRPGGGAGGGLLDDEVKGFVSNLTAGQFTINGLTVIYDASDLDSEDFSNRPLANGQFVKVHGVAVSATTLEANRIELEDNFLDDDFSNGRVEIEGVIQAVRPDAQGTGGVIVINGLEIRVDNISQFSVGLRVEIKGILQSDGIIVIIRLQDEAEDTVRTEDLAVSTDGTSLTTRLGLVIKPTSRSRLEDDTINDDDNLSIADFLGNVAGKRIEARGFPLNGEVVWIRLEIEDDDDQDCRLRGPVANITGSVNDFSFTIEGVIIDVSQVADNNFEGSGDQSIGRSAFFNQLSPGVIVQATSDKSGIGCISGMLTAREVEFEPENDIFIGGGNGINDNEINGTVSSVSGNTFVVAGQTITANANTLIDDSIIEAARGVELPNDLPLGSLLETLAQLLPIGLNVEVVVDRSNGLVALRIEDR